MKIKYFKNSWICLLLLTVVLLFSGKVQAKEYSCTISLPVETVLEGDKAPSSVNTTIIFEAVKDTNPLPEITQLSVADSEKVSFGPITYTSPEDYLYKVYQKHDNVEHVTFDDTVYTVTVRVTNAKDGGLSAIIWAIKDDSQNKVDEIKFLNSYDPPEIITNVKTSDQNNIFIWLFCSIAAFICMVIIRNAKREKTAKSL